MLTRSLATLFALTLAATSAIACSSAPTTTPPPTSEDPVSSTHQSLCTGDTCWECQDVPVKNGTKTYCETPCSSDDGGGYACPEETEGDATCPPSKADKSGGGQGKDKNKDKNPNKGNGGGGDAPSGGGGFKCKVEGGKRCCDSPPACAEGTHLAPSGKCVPDSCDCDDDTGGGGSSSGGSTPPSSGGGCTLTQGFWKNHSGAWPVDTLTIGGVSYTKAELLVIFRTAPKGDASLILGHQLIAALLNAATGASQAQVGGAIADAQAWMAANKDADGKLPYGVGSSSAATDLSSKLDTYNNGGLDIPHCD